MPNRSWVPSPGHIIRGDVPRTDSETTDPRYPVVVSNSQYNQQYPDVIVAYTTRSSNIKQVRDYDVVISDQHPDFGLTNLPVSTTVRCGRIHTIAQRKISDVIGIVPNDLLTDIQRLVLKSFEEPPKGILST